MVEVAGIKQSLVLIQSDLHHGWGNLDLGFSYRLRHVGCKVLGNFGLRDQALRF